MTEAAKMQTTVIDGVTKYTISFGLTDENGKPILDRGGKQKLTNLVADSPDELVSKLANANLEVARALERSSRRFETLSSRQPTPRPPAPDLAGKPLTAEESVQVGLDVQDPRKSAEAIKRVVESVVPVAKITKEVSRQGEQTDLEQRKRVAREFILAHKEDYLPIEANNALLNTYLLENNLEFTVSNLEYAAAAIAARLVSPRPPQPQNDPPPDQNDLPENDPPNPGNSPAQSRRAPAGGIRNSQVTDRPGGGGKLTRDQALHMLFNERPKYEAWMRDPARCKILTDALAGR